MFGICGLCAEAYRNPQVARDAVLSVSADGDATTLVWDCTAGRFDRHYDIDETVCVIEGAVRIKDPNGSVRPVGVGDVRKSR
ncbi:MAG: DUF861 domain-containing protein [Gammaproteobacteria bacterium]|nr:DUF861 domain-containing protein [Gammaproteobacteria bacterium]